MRQQSASLSHVKREDEGSSYQIRMLSNLASEVGPADQQNMQSSVLQTRPNWEKVCAVGLISEALIPVLSSFHSLSLREKFELFKSDSRIVPALFRSLLSVDDPVLLRYVLTVFYSLVRDDTSRYDLICRQFDSREVVSACSQILSNPKVDRYTANKTCFLLSGFMCRAPSNAFSLQEVKDFAVGLLKGEGMTIHGVSESGVLDAFINLLKISEFRDIVWSTRGFLLLLVHNLTESKPSSSHYQVIMCIWLLSFQPRFISDLNDSGLIKSMATLIKDTRTEKSVRVFLKALKNLIKNDQVIETLIETKTFDTLALLEYEKWRDAELYDDIHDGIDQLDSKLKNFSNFGRYCTEIESGSLKWSMLHTETFWKENVMCFEQDEFLLIRKLRSLLTSDNPVTVSVACYDIGEFARFHPAGKKICQRLKIKNSVMLLISHLNREIAREALLCLQKLMLDNWQDLANGRRRV